MNYLNPTQRLLICSGLGLITFVVLPGTLIAETRLIVSWDITMCSFLGWTWTHMLTATIAHIRERAAQEFIGRRAVPILLVGAAGVSFMALAYLLGSTRNLPVSSVQLHIVGSSLAIICSWLLVHTVFTLQYAHRFYDQQTGGGLDFPAETTPDYLDFAYFSFVIGMTSQVSDVQITSPILRRLALLQGILAFFFNTTILALTVNIVASLI